MKTLQNYIKEEIKKFEKIFGGKEHRLWLENTEMRAETDCEEELEHFFRQSLHRIAKITAEEIVPEKKELSKHSGHTFDNDGLVVYCYDCGRCLEEDEIPKGEKGYNQAISDLQSKIKEFGI